MNKKAVLTLKIVTFQKSARNILFLLKKHLHFHLLIMLQFSENARKNKKSEALDEGNTDDGGKLQ